MLVVRRTSTRLEHQFDDAYRHVERSLATGDLRDELWFLLSEVIR